MKKSLKDQLKDAGFRSGKLENHRESAKGRERKQSEKHQVTRNFCEHCELIQPDVERYKHRNPTTDAEWICLGCADKLSIDDKFRVTQQSDVSKQGMFRRYFGATKDFSKEDAGARPHFQKRPNGNRDGNRNGNRNGNHNGNRGGNGNRDNRSNNRRPRPNHNDDDSRGNC